MGKIQAYEEAIQEYLDLIDKLEDNDAIDYVVADRDGAEEAFGNWWEAVEYANLVGVDQIAVEPFEYCYGNYCDGEYVSYGRVVLDLDRNVIDWEV